MAMLTRRHAVAGVAASFSIMKPETVFGSQANSKVAFGIIGTGGRGTYVGTHMAKDANARIAAICDIFPDRIDMGKTRVPGAANVPSFRNHEELLARNDIDAVLIASPVFMHPEHFEAAVKAKKHIYCEKPAGADVAGVKRLIKAVKAADPSKTIQFGFQQRFSKEYLRGMELYKTGKLGQITLMMSFWILGGVQPKGPFQSKYPASEQKLRHWAMWRDYSGSCIVEQDCHGVDVLNWFADAHPTKAMGEGGLRYPLIYGDWTSDHHDIVYTYPNNMKGWLISIKHTAGFRDVKEQIIGSQGVLDLARTYMKWHGPIPTSPLQNADDLRDRSLIERKDSPREITIDAVEYFFKSIVEKKPYNLGMAAAESTLTSLLGRMAYEQKREVTWDELLRSA